MTGQVLDTSVFDSRVLHFAHSARLLMEVYTHIMVVCVI